MAGEQGFWNKPEGKFGMVVSAVLAAGVAWGLYKILPFLLTLVTNTITLFALCLALAGLFYVFVLDNSLRNMLANFYKRAIRAMYILSFNVDPIGGLKEHIKELRERVEYARQKATEVKGQSQAVQKTITENQQVIDRGLERMEAAQSRGEPEYARAESIKVGFTKQANQPLEQLKDRIDRSSHQLIDIIKKAELQVDVLDTMVTVKERTFKASKSGRSALKAAMSALTGDTEKDARFQDNMDWVGDYAAEAVGEMDAILELNDGAMQSIDLDQASYSDEAFKELERRQGKVQTMLESVNPKLLSSQFTPGFQAAVSSAQPPAEEAGSFAHILRKKGK